MFEKVLIKERQKGQKKGKKKKRKINIVCVYRILHSTHHPWPQCCRWCADEWRVWSQKKSRGKEIHDCNVARGTWTRPECGQDQKKKKRMWERVSWLFRDYLKLGEPSVYFKPVEQTLYSAAVPIKKRMCEWVSWLFQLSPPPPVWMACCRWCADW